MVAGPLLAIQLFNDPNPQDAALCETGLTHEAQLARERTIGHTRQITDETDDPRNQRNRSRRWLIACGQLLADTANWLIAVKVTAFDPA